MRCQRYGQAWVWSASEMAAMAVLVGFLAEKRRGGEKLRVPQHWKSVPNFYKHPSDLRMSSLL